MTYTPYDLVWAPDHDLAKYPHGQRGSVMYRRSGRDWSGYLLKGTQ